MNGWTRLVGCRISDEGCDQDAELLDDETQSERRLE